MTAQITELSERPHRNRLLLVRNPALFSGGDVLAWLTGRTLRGDANAYNGNKPDGGLWTSSWTPDDEYASDWQRGCATNSAVALAMSRMRPFEAVRRLWKLEVQAEAHVLEIASLADAQQFTQQYRLGTAPIPDSVRRSGPGLLVTTEITDWERACREWDGLHLTGAAADEIVWAILHEGEVTAFHTWNCESTLWGRWVFERVEAM